MLEADISSILYKDGVTYYTFDDFWDNHCELCLWLYNDSLSTCTYCVTAQAVTSKFKFPKVVLGHILSEEGTFGTALLSVFLGHACQFLLKSVHI